MYIFSGAKTALSFFLDRAKLVKKIWLLVPMVETFTGQEIWTWSLVLLDICLEYESVYCPVIDTVFRQTSHWDLSCYQDFIRGFLKHGVIAEISRHNALMKQHVSVICFFFLAVYMYWSRQGNVCYFYVLILQDMLSVCVLTTDPSTLYRRVHLHFLVLWDWVEGIHFSLYGRIDTVLRSGMDVWPTSINKDFWWAMLPCGHLQHRLPAYLEGYLKVICFLYWFCEE